MKKIIKITIYIIIILSILALPIRVNISSSAPKGIYYVNIFNKKYKKGDYIIYEMPEEYKYYVHENLKELETIKEIYAVENDEIKIIDNRVYINDKFVDNIYFDIPIKIKGSYKLKKDEFLTMSKEKYSLDGRYYGIIKKEKIKYKAYLLIRSDFSEYRK